MGFDMHSKIQSEKAALAKLLATENLSVVYRSDINTAYFDLKSRTIYIPIMWGMDLDLIDLFDGHEVGHALYTPPEGYHNAIKAQEQDGQFDRAYASYLNVVEDVRIERKIKSMYPGLRRSFHRAYGQLVSKNFFSPDGETPISELVKTYTFIDKLNIHSKVGSHVYVEFTKEEQDLVNECFAIETWDEVVAFVSKIYSRQLQLQQDQAAAAFSAMTAGNLLESEEQKPGDGEDSEADELETGAGQQMDSESDSDDTASNINNDQRSENTDRSENKPITVEPSVTDQAFRQNEEKMFSENAANERKRRFSHQPVTRCVVGKLPANRLVSAEKLIPTFGKMFDEYLTSINEHNNNKQLSPFNTEQVIGKLRLKHRKENGAYINHLIKEFELRKNAKVMLHGRSSKTGKLDIRKIHKYQICDDVFSRTMSFPEGTNHGMCMFFDLSGSMSNSIPGVIRQILILSEFCTKLNIPFRVFGFNNSEKSFRTYTGLSNKENKPSPPGESEDYYFGSTFHLKEYISSYLSKNDYKKAFDQLLLLGEIYYQRSRFRFGRYNIASNLLETDTLSDHESATLGMARLYGEELGSTPLVSATMASIDIVNEMIEKHNIQNMIAIVLTDGVDDDSNTIKVSEFSGVNCTAPAIIQHHSGVRMLTDKRSGISFAVNTSTKFAKKVTGAKYICYDLINSIPQTVRLYEAVERPNHSNTRSTLRNKKYIVGKKFGYDDYFFIVNEDTINSQIEDTKWKSFWTGEEAFGDGNVIVNKPKKLTAKTIAKKFANHQNQKHLVRIMLAEFAKSIAESV